MQAKYEDGASWAYTEEDFGSLTQHTKIDFAAKGNSELGSNIKNYAETDHYGQQH
jgi:hypothetical protein